MPTHKFSGGGPVIESARSRGLLTSTIAWYYVGERMPDDDVSVLIVTISGEMSEAFHADGQWWYDNGNTVPERVTGWADYPEPPALLIGKVRRSPKPLRARPLSPKGVALKGGAS